MHLGTPNLGVNDRRPNLERRARVGRTSSDGARISKAFVFALENIVSVMVFILKNVG